MRIAIEAGRSADLDGEDHREAKSKAFTTGSGDSIEDHANAHPRPHARCR
jgi:hypothetical protein